MLSLFQRPRDWRKLSSSSSIFPVGATGISASISISHNVSTGRSSINFPASRSAPCAARVASSEKPLGEMIIAVDLRAVGKRYFSVTWIRFGLSCSV